MANTITISLNIQDQKFLEENKDVSPTELFRNALILERHKEEFLDIYTIVDYKLKIKELQEKIYAYSKEIERRNERIDSLQDVLAQKELTERRIRNSIKENNGLNTAITTA